MADTSAASALHAPPPSYGDAAPPLKGILKNAPRRSSSAAHPAPDDVLAGPAPEPCPPAATIPALHPSEPPPANTAEGAVPYRDSDGRYVSALTPFASGTVKPSAICILIHYMPVCAPWAPRTDRLALYRSAGCTGTSPIWPQMITGRRPLPRA